MLLSDYIAQLIEQMLTENGGKLELRRNDMAEQIGCAPSQINYVITSRFTPGRGYMIESRRGGGGYIKIVRKEMTADRYLMHVYHSIGDMIGEGEAAAIIKNICQPRDGGADKAALCLAAVSNAALSKLTDKSSRDIIRADILRQLVLSMMQR